MEETRGSGVQGGGNASQKADESIGSTPPPQEQIGTAGSSEQVGTAGGSEQVGTAGGGSAGAGSSEQVGTAPGQTTGGRNVLLIAGAIVVAAVLALAAWFAGH